MDFAYGVIAIVGVLAAVSIGFIAVSPDDIIKPRTVSVEETPAVCTMQWDPVCGVDGETFGNLCMLDAAGIKLDHSGKCEILQEDPKSVSVNPHIMPKTAAVGDVLLIEVEFMDDDGNIVDHVYYDIFAIQDNKTVLSDPGSHRHPGKHPVHKTTALGESQVAIKVTVQGLGHGDKTAGPKGIESFMIFVPEPQPESSSLPAAIPSDSLTVEIAEGSGSMGCGAIDECYLPYSLEVGVSDTVVWNNIDTVVHTVTGGSNDAGLSGAFDSGMLVPGSTFEFTFDDAGTYDYICIVHPWMTGIVTVNQNALISLCQSATNAR